MPFDDQSSSTAKKGRHLTTAIHWRAIKDVKKHEEEQ